MESSHSDAQSEDVRVRNVLQRVVSTEKWQLFQRHNSISSLDVSIEGGNYVKNDINSDFWCEVTLACVHRRTQTKAQTSPLEQLAPTRAQYSAAKSYQSLRIYFQKLSPLTSCPWSASTSRDQRSSACLKTTWERETESERETARESKKDRKSHRDRESKSETERKQERQRQCKRERERAAADCSQHVNHISGTNSF